MQYNITHAQLLQFMVQLLDWVKKSNQNNLNSDRYLGLIYFLPLLWLHTSSVGCTRHSCGDSKVFGRGHPCQLAGCFSCSAAHEKFTGVVKSDIFSVHVLEQ